VVTRSHGHDVQRVRLRESRRPGVQTRGTHRQAREGRGAAIVLPIGLLLPLTLFVLHRAFIPRLEAQALHYVLPLAILFACGFAAGYLAPRGCRTALGELSEPIPRAIFTEVCYKLHFAAREVDSFYIDPNDRQSVSARVEGSAHDAVRKMKQVASRAIAEMAEGTDKSESEVAGFGRPTSGPRPFSALRQSGHLVEFSQGFCGIGKGLLASAGEVEEKVVALAGSFGAVEYRYPPVLPVSFLDRIGYFQSSPHALMFVKHLVSDAEIIDGFMRRVRLVDGHLDGDAGRSTGRGVRAPRPGGPQRRSVLHEVRRPVTGRARSGGNGLQVGAAGRSSVPIRQHGRRVLQRSRHVLHKSFRDHQLW